MTSLILFLTCRLKAGTNSSTYCWQTGKAVGVLWTQAANDYFLLSSTWSSHHQNRNRKSIVLLQFSSHSQIFYYFSTGHFRLVYHSQLDWQLLSSLTAGLQHRKTTSLAIRMIQGESTGWRSRHLMWVLFHFCDRMVISVRTQKSQIIFKWIRLPALLNLRRGSDLNCSQTSPLELVLNSRF